MYKNKATFLLFVVLSAIIPGGCASYPQLVTSQYVDKPVIIGPYWKVGTKLEDYRGLKEQKGFREFETEVERSISTTTSQQGNVQYTQTSRYAVHSDNISKDILMLNPADDELVLIRRCYLGAYFMGAPGGTITKTFGGVEGFIMPRPGRTTREK